MNSYDASQWRDDVVGRLVAQLLQTTGCLMLIINHMAEWSSSGRVPDDAPAFDDVLAGIVREAIEPFAARHAVCDLEFTAALLHEVSEAVGQGIFLAPLEEPPCDRPRVGGAAARRRRPE